MITMCGACNEPSGEGARPGLIVVNLNSPLSSVSTRPKPRKRGEAEFRRAKLAWITARGIGLPDFEHSIGNGLSISIEDFATNGDARR